MPVCKYDANNRNVGSIFNISMSERLELEEGEEESRINRCKLVIVTTTTAIQIDVHQ